MAKIQHLLDKIRTAIYGKEVRGSLADGLEAINKETEDATEVAVNVEQRQDAVEQQFDDVLNEWTGDKPISNEETIAARTNRETGENHQTLGQRLDAENKKVTAQLAETEKQITILQENKMEKSVGATKQELNDFKITANNAINEKRDKTTAITMSDLSQGVKEAMTGGSVAVVDENAVSNINVVDKSLTPRKLSFVKPGKNKFDGFYHNGLYIDGGSTASGGILKKSANDGYACAIVPVEPNTTYAISKGGGDRFRIAANAGFPEADERLTRFMLIEDSGYFYTFTTGPTEDYIVVYTTTPSGSLPDWLQVEEGSQATPYEPQRVVVDLEKDSINMNMIQDGRIKATLVGSATAFNVDTVNQKIITKSQASFVQAGDDRYALRDKEYDYSSISFNTIIITFNTSLREIEFYGVDSIHNVDKTKTAIVGVIRKNENIVIIDGFHQINGEIVRPSGNNNNHNTTFKIVNNVFENYEQITNLITPKTDVHDLYAIYDNLVDSFPDYVSRTFLGSEPTGLPIYRYDFIPPKPLVFSNPFPKVFYSTHTHGHERIAAAGAAAFFKDLCESWETNNALQMLRWNVEFTVIPALNPWGINNFSRTNSNGVDLNRNFTYRWEYGGDGTVYYSGPTSLSEIETQCIKNIMENESFDLAIDHHHYEGISHNPHAFYVSSESLATRQALSPIAQSFAPYLKKTFDGIPNNNDSIVKVSGGSGADGGMVYLEWELYGTKSVLLETGVSVGDGGTDLDVQKMTSYISGNLVTQLMLNFDWLNEG